MQQIVAWPVPRSVKDVCAFVGVCVYYCIFIAGFSTIIAPIIMLFWKGVRFEWTEERQEAMDILKRKLTQAPVLIALDFSVGAGRIYLMVDASRVGWGGAMERAGGDGL